jgi:hypothetical protein
MVSGHDEDSQLARALAGGKPHPTGSFRLYFKDERWEWSPEVERLHGYEPGTANQQPARCYPINIQRTTNR